MMAGPSVLRYLQPRKTVPHPNRTKLDELYAQKPVVLAPLEGLPAMSVTAPNVTL